MHTSILYSPLFEGPFTNHCALIIDLDSSLLFGTCSLSVDPPSTRNLYSSNVKVSATYQHILSTQLAHYNITTCLTSLLTKLCCYPFCTSCMHKEAKSLDSTIAKAMKYTEKKVTYFHHDAWSPCLIKAGLTLKYWCVILSGLQCNINVTSILWPLYTWFPHLPLPTSTHTITQALAYFKYTCTQAWVAKAYAALFQKDFLQELAQAQAVTH